MFTPHVAYPHQFHGLGEAALAPAVPAEAAPRIVPRGDPNYTPVPISAMDQYVIPTVKTGSAMLVGATVVALLAGARRWEGNAALWALLAGIPGALGAGVITYGTLAVANKMRFGSWDIGWGFIWVALAALAGAPLASGITYARQVRPRR